MPKRAVASDQVFKGSLPFAQATIAGCSPACANSREQPRS
jgi:hypothetical protein